MEGTLIGELNEEGEPVVGDTLLILLNAHHETIPFTLPPHRDKEIQLWERILDTALPDAQGQLSEEVPYPLEGRSLAVLRKVCQPTSKRGDGTSIPGVKGERGALNPTP